MTYQEILEAARGKMGRCKACPVCNGLACKNAIPGPGSKGSGTVAARNYQKWQELRLNMDTIGAGGAADTRHAGLCRAGGGPGRPLRGGV